MCEGASKQTLDLRILPRRWNFVRQSTRQRSLLSCRVASIILLCSFERLGMLKLGALPHGVSGDSIDSVKLK